jgi:hypothetical protein
VYAENDDVNVNDPVTASIVVIRVLDVANDDVEAYDPVTDSNVCRRVFCVASVCDETTYEAVFAFEAVVAVPESEPVNEPDRLDVPSDTVVPFRTGENIFIYNRFRINIIVELLVLLLLLIVLGLI